VSALFDRIKREPVLLLTLAIALLQSEAFTDADWKTAAIAVLSVLVRFLVTPNPTAVESVETAYVWGLEDGEAGPNVIDVDS
jgi:hypothetical protein